MNWHVPPTTLEAYVAGQVGEADAWSIESHLTACERCRRAVATVAWGPEPSVAPSSSGSSIGPQLDEIWNALDARPPAQGRARPGTRRRAARVLLTAGPAARWAWLVAVAAVLAVAVGYELVLDRPTVLGTSVPLLVMLAPVLPVLGVAASYGRGLDDAYEVIAATPAGGLRLLLLRTVSVLAVAVPATLMAGLLAGIDWSVVWLLPSLALTLATLALGSMLDVTRAALVVGGAWAALVLGPGLEWSTVPALNPATMPLWLAVAVAAGVFVAVRRDSFYPRIRIEV